MFEGQIDRTALGIGRGKRALDIEFVLTAERFFSINEERRRVEAQRTSGVTSFGSGLAAYRGAQP